MWPIAHFGPEITLHFGVFWQKFVFPLKIHVFTLKIHIFTLKIHILKPSHCTAFWGPGNHLKLPPFFNQNLHKEIDFGVKKNQLSIFSKNYFWHQKSSKKLGRFVDFYMTISEHLIAGLPEYVEIFFTFNFWKSIVL